MSVEPAGAGCVVEGAGAVVDAATVVGTGAGAGASVVVVVDSLAEQAVANRNAATATGHCPAERSATGWSLPAIRHRLFIGDQIVLDGRSPGKVGEHPVALQSPVFGL